MVFECSKNTLRDALQITPVNNNTPFSSPPTPDALINFINDLGYLNVEEFTQSIHFFIKDKKNLALHTQGKKKANPLMILSIKFSKLIIHYLQNKHKFHPRPDSPLHLLYEGYVLGYLKFNAKGTKREVFGMPIPNELITADIQEGSGPDSPAPKPAKATKPEATNKSKPSAPKAAPVKPQEMKRKIVTETSEAPSPAKQSKAGKGSSGASGSSQLPPPPPPPSTNQSQAGPNPGIQDEGQAGSNPGDAAESQPQSSHVVHAGPNLEHMDFEVTNASTQQNPEQMDEEFTTTAYPSVQENLKLPTEDQVRLEEPASSAGTLSSLQNLDKELSFTNQFLVEKSQEDEHDKSNTEAEVQSMVTVPIHQDTSLVPLMTTSVIDLTMSQHVSTMVQAPLPTSTSTVTVITTTTSILPPPPQPQQSIADPILVRRIGELEQHMADILQDNLALGERLDKHGTRL
ncbi:hypothetical protein Tco_0830983 [Tanacetum coccineum]